MTHTCPGCGFVSGAEARYCRMCGTPLPRAANVSGDAEDSVSPHADTVPLAGPTENISPHDTGSPVPSETSRVARDFEEFRRRADLVQARLAAEAESRAHDQPWPAPSDAPAGGGDDELTVIRRDDEVTKVRPPEVNRVRPDDEVTTIHVRSIDGDGSTSSSSLRRAADTGELAAAPPPTARHARSHQTTTTRAPGAASANVERRAMRLWVGFAVFGVVILLCVAAAVGVAWYMTRGGRDEQPAAATTTGDPASAAPPGEPATPATADAKQQAAAKLAEAEQLLAAGRADEAVARLRDAAALDPSDAEPRRRLARMLLESGSRRTAIEELRAVLRIDGRDAQAWRDLAQAQGAEGLHRDAAESYRRLFEVSAEARGNDRLQLARADALLRSGRETDARAAYERLSDSRVAEVARASRRQLARLEREGEENANGEPSNTSAAASPAPAATRDARGPAANEIERGRGDSAARPPDAANLADSDRAAQLSPRERYERGVRLWQSNRSAAVADFAAAAQAGNSDANYYLGLSLVEGRDARALSRGQLVAALNYFERARRGRHAAEARRRVEELGREYDRRRGVNVNQR